MKQLPLINIAALRDGTDAQRQAVVDAIGRAFHEIGFIMIEGHGIQQTTISTLRQQVMALFQLPLVDKMALAVSPENYRGYIPLGFFTPNASGPDADHYEGYKLHWDVTETDPICKQCDLYGPNKWPSQLPELKTAAVAYWAECDRVCRMLLGAIVEHIQLRPDYFVDPFTKPLTNMTLLHYPPGRQFTEGGQQAGYGIHPHKDTDALTILAPDPVGGLYVRGKGSSQWITADAPDHALIVNIGDMLETWSGGYFVSTPHKVQNTSAQERYSFPYFAVPRFDVEVKPVGLRKTRKFDHPAMHAGNVSREIWHSNWPDATPINPLHDPYSH